MMVWAVIALALWNVWLTWNLAVHTAALRMVDSCLVLHDRRLNDDREDKP